MVLSAVRFEPQDDGDVWKGSGDYEGTRSRSSLVPSLSCDWTKADCSLFEQKFCVKCIDYFEDEQRIWLVLEYVDGGDLLDYVMKRRGLSAFSPILFGNQRSDEDLSEPQRSPRHASSR